MKNHKLRLRIWFKEKNINNIEFPICTHMNWFCPKPINCMHRFKHGRRKEPPMFLHVKLVHTTRLHWDECPLMEVSLFSPVVCYLLSILLYLETTTENHVLNPQQQTFVWYGTWHILLNIWGMSFVLLPTWLRLRGASGVLTKRGYCCLHYLKESTPKKRLMLT